jgi:hypothetical protein
MRVLSKSVTVRDWSARVPALQHALLHPTAALLDQVPDVPLGDALLDAAGKDRGGVRGERLVGCEQSDVALLELALDLRGVCGHPREPVDRFDDHGVEGIPFGSSGEQVSKPAVSGHGDAEPRAVALAALVEPVAA